MRRATALLSLAGCVLAAGLVVGECVRDATAAAEVQAVPPAPPGPAPADGRRGIATAPPTTARPGGKRAQALTDAAPADPRAASADGANAAAAPGAALPARLSRGDSPN